MHRFARLASVCACLALAAAAAASAQSLSFSPGEPDARDAIAIAVRYTSPCPGDGGRAELRGTEIALLATENCGCSPFAHAENAVTFVVAPLPQGSYTVNLYAAANEEQPGCAFAPRLVGGSSLAVAPAELLIATDPEEPTAGEPVTLVLRHRCPLDFGGPAVADRVIRVLGSEDPLAAPRPCAPAPTFESRIRLGSLAQGPYTVLVLVEADDEPRLLAAESFGVAPGAEEELILGGRFRVATRWRIASGTSGSGIAVGLSENSGAFWFFRPSNLELLVKVLDGCTVNGHFWVLAAGLTNVEVRLLVEDLGTGEIRSYLNPLGRPYEPVLDTGALPCS